MQNFKFRFMVAFLFVAVTTSVTIIQNEQSNTESRWFMQIQNSEVLVPAAITVPAYGNLFYLSILVSVVMLLACCKIILAAQKTVKSFGNNKQEVLANADLSTSTS